MKINWECPFCNHKAVVHDGNEGTISTFRHRFKEGNKYGHQLITGQVIVCPNSECEEYAVYLFLADSNYEYGQYIDKQPKRVWQLIPESDAKVFPSYVPQALRDDYREACLIKKVSPKASATLSRRCIQGIIRDFWKVTKARLVDEVDAIKDRVDPVTWEAIDSVRKIGNIGAHMEKDINIIVEVEPEEASLLISLIETLLVDWYVARHERQQRMLKIKAVSDAKENARQQPQKKVSGS